MAARLPGRRRRTYSHVIGVHDAPFGRKHRAEGVPELLPEYEPGLTDIEGFSHVMLRLAA